MYRTATVSPESPPAGRPGDVPEWCGDAETVARADGVKVIARAARVLRLVAASPLGPTSVQAAQRLGLPRSTVYRIVGALEEEGLLRVDDDRRLALGPAAGGVAARESAP